MNITSIARFVCEDCEQQHFSVFVDKNEITLICIECGTSYKAYIKDNFIFIDAMR